MRMLDALTKPDLDYDDKDDDEAFANKA